jgi:hypothetical protein
VTARFKRLAPFFLIGPISGPLLAGVVFNFRDGRPLLGSLYAVAFTEFLFLLPAVTTKLSANLVQMGYVVPGVS